MKCHPLRILLISLCVMPCYTQAADLTPVPPHTVKVSSVEKIQRAANQGDPNAQVHLGQMYLSGKGITQNEAQAFFWFQKAAHQGHAAGQMYLGEMYYGGVSVPEDYAKALYWFQKAANQGNVRAQEDLGLMYESGAGVTQDYQKAMYWYNKADAQRRQNKQAKH